MPSAEFERWLEALRDRALGTLCRNTMRSVSLSLAVDTEQVAARIRRELRKLY